MPGRGKGEVAGRQQHPRQGAGLLVLPIGSRALVVSGRGEGRGREVGDTRGDNCSELAMVASQQKIWAGGTRSKLVQPRERVRYYNYTPV